MSGFLREYLRTRLKSATKTLAEPFCGGAGASVTLLLDGTVDQILLNDLDIRVYSAWNAIINETDRFVKELKSVPLTLPEWHRRFDFVNSQRENNYSFDLGFSAFYVNRTSRSGIISRSGPIGGLEQNGRWKLDARFNRERLSEKVLMLGKMRRQISITNCDGLSFLYTALSGTHNPLKETALLIDPPYFNQGRRLYFDGMSEGKHVALHDMLAATNHTNWILTYDNCQFIRNLYAKFNVFLMDVTYCLQSRRKAQEVIISPDVKIPSAA